MTKLYFNKSDSIIIGTYMKDCISPTLLNLTSNIYYQNYLTDELVSELTIHSISWADSKKTKIVVEVEENLSTEAKIYINDEWIPVSN